MENIML